MEDDMAGVTARTANWRLFGGSALLIGGILWVLAYAVGTLPWLTVLAFLVIAAGLVIVALGQTGGNGAVGKYVLGKVALVVYAAGWAILAIAGLVALPSSVIVFAAVFILVGGPVSAWAVYTKSVAKGAARWILFVPAVIGAIWALSLITASLALPGWIALLLALAFAATGALYLLNDRKLG
jgi:hypothetical protein